MLPLPNLVAQLLLLHQLHPVEPGHQVVVDLILQLCQPVQVGQEPTANLRLDERRQLRIAQSQPAARGDAVGLVLEPLRIAGVPVPEQVAFQQLRVNLCHAVDGRGHVHGQVGHVGGVVLQDEQVPVRVLGFQAGVDALQDGANFRHHRPQQLHVPLLQRLAHHRVVGVGEHLPGELKGGVKGQPTLHQQPHQLRDGQGGVGVVELDGAEGGQVFPVVSVGGLVAPQDVLQRRGGQHVLLLDAQPLALPGGVVGVEHPGDVLGGVLLRQRLVVVLGVERLKVQLVHRLALPQPQGADVVVAVADDGHIVGDGDDGLVGKGDPHGVFVPAIAPRVAEVGPVVDHLLLSVVLEPLLEQPEPVAQSIAGQREIQGSGAVQKARRQPSQAAVAQRGVLHLLQHGQIDPTLGEGGAHLLQDAQVVEVAVDEPPHQVLGGEIIRLAQRRTPPPAGAPLLGDGQHHRFPQTVVEAGGVGLHQTLVVTAFEDGLGGVDDAVDDFIHRQFAPESRSRADDRPLLPASAGYGQGWGSAVPA